MDNVISSIWYGLRLNDSRVAKTSVQSWCLCKCVWIQTGTRKPSYRYKHARRESLPKIAPIRLQRCR